MHGIATNGARKKRGLRGSHGSHGFGLTEYLDSSLIEGSKENYPVNTNGMVTGSGEGLFDTQETVFKHNNRCKNSFEDGDALSSISVEVGVLRPRKTL